MKKKTRQTEQDKERYNKLKSLITKVPTELDFEINIRSLNKHLHEVEYATSD